MKKKFTAQIVIGATIEADSVWLARKFSGELIESLAVPAEIEMTALSVSFIPRQADPMELMAEMGRTQGPANGADDAVAGSIPQGAPPS